MTQKINSTEVSHTSAAPAFWTKEYPLFQSKASSFHKYMFKMEEPICPGLYPHGTPYWGSIVRVGFLFQWGHETIEIKTYPQKDQTEGEGQDMR